MPFQSQRDQLRTEFYISQHTILDVQGNCADRAARRKVSRRKSTIPLETRGGGKTHNDSPDTKDEDIEKR